MDCLKAIVPIKYFNMSSKPITNHMDSIISVLPFLSDDLPFAPAPSAPCFVIDIGSGSGLGLRL